MHRRKNILAALRKQRARLGRCVVILFAFASLALSGAPCFAMATASPGPATDEAAPAHGLHHASASDHSMAAEHAVAHDHAAEALAKPQPSAPAHCPHCPLTAAMPGHSPSSAHSFCSAVDEGADQTSASSLPAFAKVAPAVNTFEIPALSSWRPPPIRSIAAVSPPITVALNVRHCVFLI
jgi:hypothetical protein